MKSVPQKWNCLVGLRGWETLVPCGYRRQDLHGVGLRNGSFGFTCDVVSVCTARKGPAFNFRCWPAIDCTTVNSLPRLLPPPGEDVARSTSDASEGPPPLQFLYLCHFRRGLFSNLPSTRAQDLIELDGGTDVRGRREQSTVAENGTEPSIDAPHGHAAVFGKIFVQSGDEERRSETGAQDSGQQTGPEGRPAMLASVSFSRTAWEVGA